MAITKDEETYLKNQYQVDLLQKQIDAKIKEKADHEILKKTEIDDYNTTKNAEIQTLQSQIDAIK